MPVNPTVSPHSHTHTPTHTHSPTHPPTRYPHKALDQLQPRRQPQGRRGPPQSPRALRQQQHDLLVGRDRPTRPPGTPQRRPLHRQPPPHQVPHRRYVPERAVADQHPIPYTLTTPPLPRDDRQERSGKRLQRPRHLRSRDVQAPEAPQEARRYDATRFVSIPPPATPRSPPATPRLQPPPGKLLGAEPSDGDVEPATPGCCK